ncbi:MAG: dual specificity protein phosphatase family protein [Chloroflexi bacterium]|nr:dual specificity protein phosphatase family protein [Chloroflexota bacterium]
MNSLTFSWLIEGRLVGHRGPSSEQDLLRLQERGILALVRMATINDEAKISSAEVERLGMSDCHEPVADFNPSKQSQIDRMVGVIVKALSEARPVGISCGAGLGRTGTTLACYLVRQGSGH